jgi:hypothetical protein
VDGIHLLHFQFEVLLGKQQFQREKAIGQGNHVNSMVSIAEVFCQNETIRLGSITLHAMRGGRDLGDARIDFIHNHRAVGGIFSHRYHSARAGPTSRALTP